MSSDSNIDPVLQLMSQHYYEYFQLSVVQEDTSREARMESDKIFHYWEEVHAFIYEHPEQGLSLILALIDRAPEDERWLGFVAAGPLEDLISNYPELVIESVEQEVRKNPVFGLCLSGVWGHNRMPPAIRKRIDVALRGSFPS